MGNMCYTIEAKEMQSTIRRKDGVVMNIPELSTALSSSRLLNQVGTAMLSKSLDPDDGSFHGAVCESFGRKQY